MCTGRGRGLTVMVASGNESSHIAFTYTDNGESNKTGWQIADYFNY